MGQKVLMPQLGESVTEGTISKWLVQAGDTVKKYDPICEVSTDKVNAEVPTSFSGTITELVVAEGETVDVGSLICYIQTEAQTDPAPPSEVAQVSLSDESGSSEDRKLRYSPAVLKLAAEYAIDLTQLGGSGAGGRITRKDVLGYIESGGAEVTAENSPSSEQISQQEPVQPLQQDVPAQITSYGDRIVPITSIRKTIARRMVQSKQEVPHAWTMIECDVTSMVELRNQIKGDFKQKEGVALTYLPFFINAVVAALKEFPLLNSTWAQDQIIIKKAINISIAVATEEELFVPVIKHADQLSILGIAKAIDALVRKTKAGNLTLEDMSGGTFTVNNTGAFGSIQSAPIINPPQAAILSIESIVQRPVIIQNMIAVRNMVNLCLSLDHRVLDGLICGRFLQHVKTKLESYGPETKLY
jgi:2-oxoisovalerate dehydrogenase E2 component (dihydrolipoyl transacylase)